MLYGLVLKRLSSNLIFFLFNLHLVSLVFILVPVLQLGIQSTTNDPTPQEAMDELVARISGLFTNEVSFLVQHFDLISFLFYIDHMHQYERLKTFFFLPFTGV